jgi:hypothetical protein
MVKDLVVHLNHVGGTNKHLSQILYSTILYAIINKGIPV